MNSNNRQLEMSFPTSTFQRSRPVPRDFHFPWGSGQIVEEAAFRGKHHEPVIQLLSFESGMSLVRFCSYTLSGRFERNSWLAGADELIGLREKLKHTPRLRAMLQEMLTVQSL